jgi:micrococcal nuclease
MRPRASAAFVLPLLLALPLFAAPGDEVGSVLRVVDGDTLQVRIAGRAEKVRLIGVDTPESVDPRRPVQYFGKEAAEFTRGLAAGRTVTLQGEQGAPGRDKYNRLLRYVFLPDGRLLNAEIIRQGYGHAYLRYPFSRMEEFRAHERRARAQGLGLWAAGARPAVAPASPLVRGPLVGSLRGRVFHRPGCVKAARIGPANRIVFADSREATSAGYGPCRVCLGPSPRR